MTFNYMKKERLDEMFNKLDINNIDESTVFAIKKILETEMNLSLRVEQEEPHFSPRSVICFKNCMNCLKRNNIENAWWEMTDIISYKKPDEFLTTDEIVLVCMAFENIIEKITTMREEMAEEKEHC